MNLRGKNQLEISWLSVTAEKVRGILFSVMFVYWSFAVELQYYTDFSHTQAPSELLSVIKTAYHLQPLTI